MLHLLKFYVVSFATTAYLFANGYEAHSLLIVPFTDKSVGYIRTSVFNVITDKQYQYKNASCRMRSYLAAALNKR